MARRYNRRSAAGFVDAYVSWESVTALAAMVYLAAVGVVFGVIDVEFLKFINASASPEIAAIVASLAVVVPAGNAFNRDWQYMDALEVGSAVIAVLSILGYQYVSEFQSFVTSNDPLASGVLLVVSFVAFVAVTR